MGIADADTRKTVRRLLQAVDRNAADFFVVAPFVIDCSDDFEAFEEAVPESVRQMITSSHEQRALRFVSGLRGGAKLYAMSKLRERFAALDRRTVSQIEALLDEWRTERDRNSTQRSKEPRSLEGGVDIILPLRGIRLSYDLACLTSVAS
jgi:hypothetical protein